jgi:3-methylcrotonyl-CoA carboxylase alpha subunit
MNEVLRVPKVESVSKTFLMVPSFFFLDFSPLNVQQRKRPWREAFSVALVSSYTFSYMLSPSSLAFRRTITTQKRFLSSSRPFDKVLIANRGEIACRVIRTCRRLGVETVAVYSSADTIHSLHASMADEAYCVGTGPSARESYLLGNELLEIAHQSGAQAIHPGYGFLSENAKFCQRVKDQSLVFVGPGPQAIQAMGSKSDSKAIMEAANVSITPGYHGANQDPEHLLHQAVTNVGFPLLIKAAMGGGGKGMRQVWNEKDFLLALESCKRESQSAFGDDSVILEKFLVHPRHVEVQVVADTHGNVLHLYERDCSLQRRHQKIIEEAPAADLDPDLRDELGEMGKRAAQAAGYVNAGTVEFLLDTQERGKFYFCEMNTRLQVEHPVTELITGIDLVEWQLRIAAGEELPIKNQSEVPCVGHAMEARIYAENPSRDFLPATGNVWHHGTPAEPNTGVSRDGVRVDTGIKPGQDITVYYDPMISKLIVHGENRTVALNRLISALKGYQIAGVPTNIDFLVKCAEHEVFQEAGAINTGFLDEHADELNVGEDFMEPSVVCKAIGAFVVLLQLENRIGVQDLVSARQSATPWSSYAGSWRMGGRQGRRKLNMTLSTEEPQLECWSNPDGSFDIGVPSDDQGMEYFNVAGVLDSNNRMDIILNGAKRVSGTAVMKNNNDDGTVSVHLWPEGQGEEYSVAMVVENPLVPIVHEGESVSLRGALMSPMPGKIVRINAIVGDVVKSGDVVMVMEAMKMEHSIRAPRDGTIVEMNHAVGDIVGDMEALAVVDDDSIDASDIL